MHQNIGILEKNMKTIIVNGLYRGYLGGTRFHPSTVYPKGIATRSPTFVPSGFRV